jgi:protein tyrosine phosphatase (PTP) superfamily phosphohydrolase (DUF442 family)
VGIQQSYNFRRVNERLTTSGLATVEQLGGLSGEGYDTVINLLPEDSEHAVADEARIVREQQLDYVYIPVDFAAPAHADLEAFSRALDEHHGEQVHVHCAANYRVSAFYGLYAVQRGLWSVDEADAFLADLWDPSEHPVWAAFIDDERQRLTG